jgi:hypothetical protein
MKINATIGKDAKSMLYYNQIMDHPTKSPKQTKINRFCFIGELLEKSLIKNFWTLII